jgi:hypothetical protein
VSPSDPLPLILLPREDGRHELRAFSDDSDDPIVLLVDDADGREFRRAVAEVLDAAGSGDETRTAHVEIDGRDVEIAGTADGGLRLTVSR